MPHISIYGFDSDSMCSTQSTEAWLAENGFSEREIKQILWSWVYAFAHESYNDESPLAFAHGAIGHNDMLIIAKLIEIVKKQIIEKDLEE